MKKLLGVVGLIACLLGGCTPYHAYGIAGGYRDTQLSPDVFRVTFQGNGYTPQERVQDYTLLRASELTLQHGFRYFVILTGGNSTQQSNIVIPGQTTTTGSVNVYGNTAYYSSYTSSTPDTSIPVNSHKTGLLIHCLREKPEGAFAFDATFLQSTLKSKYNIE